MGGAVEARSVLTRDDFIRYLYRLDTDTGGEHLTAQPGTRTNDDVGTFLWAWVGVLSSDIRDHARSGDASDVPGWAGLAIQLKSARVAQPGYNCVLVDSGMRAVDVATMNDLRLYLAQAATDFGRDRRATAAKQQRGEWIGDGGTWAYHALGDWLDGWARWLGDTCLGDTPKKCIHGANLEPVTWHSIACQVDAAQIYE